MSNADRLYDFYTRSQLDALYDQYVGKEGSFWKFGTVELGKGVQSVDVTFGTAFPDANYQVFVTPVGSSPGCGVYIDTKNATGFTLKVVTPNANKLTFDWFAVRP